MMKKIVSVFVLFLNIYTCYSQEMIYFKDGSIKVVKVKKIGVAAIWYKVYDMQNSPLFKVSVSDVSSIINKDGHQELLPAKNSLEKTITPTDNSDIEQKIVKFDPSNSSTLYILFDYKTDGDVLFPLYLNEKCESSVEF
ncbi:MAG: hypothetical protein Q8M08_05985 [Bacteroidales bacterium]|nr:hypothetical protein [Bacteroidales bacterium]